MSRLIALALFAMLGQVAPAAAEYPERPITMIVPFAAGGPTDTIARIVGEYMQKSLGQPILVENVAGAGGTTGITRGAQAKPDGYTIMICCPRWCVPAGHACSGRLGGARRGTRRCRS